MKTLRLDAGRSESTAAQEEVITTRLTEDLKSEFVIGTVTDIDVPELQSTLKDASCSLHSRFD